MSFGPGSHVSCSLERSGPELCPVPWRDFRLGARGTQPLWAGATSMLGDVSGEDQKMSFEVSTCISFECSTES